MPILNPICYCKEGVQHQKHTRLVSPDILHPVVFPEPAHVVPCLRRYISQDQVYFSHPFHRRLEVGIRLRRVFTRENMPSIRVMCTSYNGCVAPTSTKNHSYVHIMFFLLYLEVCRDRQAAGLPEHKKEVLYTIEIYSKYIDIFISKLQQCTRLVNSSFAAARAR